MESARVLRQDAILYEDAVRESVCVELAWGVEVYGDGCVDDEVKLVFTLFRIVVLVLCHFF